MESSHNGLSEMIRYTHIVMTPSMAWSPRWKEWNSRKPFGMGNTVLCLLICPAMSKKQYIPAALASDILFALDFPVYDVFSENKSKQKYFFLK